MNNKLLILLAAAAIAWGVSCSGEDPGSNDEDDQGWLLDGGERDDDDAGPRDVAPGDADPTDVGAADAEPGGDASGDDAGHDVEDDGGDDPSIRTIPDYRRCFTDSECPVGLGSCVKEVSLNRPDADGSEAVAIGEIFEELEDGQGICTFVCTDNPDSCQDLSVNGTTDDPVEHTCQVVTVGEAPYPQEAPGYPFDDQLDADEQAEGQPFGAICRPPVELDDAVDDSFCAQCQGSGDCSGSGSLCWSFMNEDQAGEDESGVCLSACADDSECPLGFSCDAVVDGDDDEQEGDDQGGGDQQTSGQRYCRPTLDTCTGCRDVDGDGYGTGLCESGDNPVTPYDCDDRNADAYFNPADMDHAFPTFCGEQDFNCDGRSDRSEQVGAEQYPAEHCTGCFDTCAGDVANGQRGCELDDAADTSQPACMAQCETDEDGQPLFADCDGEVSNGCEVAIDDPDRLFYRDIDGDGYGDPNDVEFACDSSLAPVGYVQNNDDCNDSSEHAWGGDSPAEEVCDGIDNDCDGEVDEELEQQDTSCTTDHPGVCAAGAWQCQGSAGFECVADIEPGAQTESCDGVDNDCDGEIDEDGADGATAYYVDSDDDGQGDADDDSPRYACSNPGGYAANNTDCNDDEASAYDGAAEVCDGIDNDCDGEADGSSAVDAQTWYEDSDSDGYGNPATTAQACGQPSGYVSNDDDCDDNNSTITPDAVEKCGDGIDNDCDGEVDEADGGDARDSMAYYVDDDGDNYGDEEGEPVYSCSNPSDGGTSYVTNNDDCNDGTASANPSVTEICDGIDNDCDGNTDGGCPHGWIEGTGSISTRERIGSTGDETETDTCGGNRVWAGVSVELYPGSWPVQEIDFACRYLETEVVDTSQSPYEYNVVHAGGIDWDDGARAGDGGSSNRTAHCNDGEAIYKVKINYDSLVQNVTFYCREYNVEGTQTSKSLKAGTDSVLSMDGSESGTDYTSTCPGDQVAVGAKIHHGEYYYSAYYYNTIYGIELRCQDIEMREL